MYLNFCSLRQVCLFDLEQNGFCGLGKLVVELQPREEVGLEAGIRLADLGPILQITFDTYLLKKLTIFI
jgi:hypothetical protein